MSAGLSKTAAKAKKRRDKSPHKKLCWAAIICVSLSLVLMLIEYLFKVALPEKFSPVMDIVFGAAVTELLFEWAFKKNLEENISDLQRNTKKLNKDVGFIDNNVVKLDTGVVKLNTGVVKLDTDVGKLDTDIGKLDTDVSKIDKALKVSEDVVGSGLAGIYATRQESLKEIEEKLDKALKSIKPGNTEKKIEVSLLGMSLGAFLTRDSQLGLTFRDVLHSDAFNIKLAILDDGCKAAYCRARVEERTRYKRLDKSEEQCWNCEEGVEYCRNLYQDATRHNKLKGSLDYLKDLAPEQIMGNLEAYTYKILPMVFMFRMDNDMFVEQYYLGSRGEQPPVLHIQKHENEENTKESQLFRIFMAHFDTVFAMGEGIKP